MLTVVEAAKRLGLRPSTIRAWMRMRKIGYVRLGRAVRILPSEIDRLIEENIVPARKRERMN